MYPQDNIFNIYYNIGRIVPFQVKRADRGFQALPENLYKPTGRTFMVEKVEPKRMAIAWLTMFVVTNISKSTIPIIKLKILQKYLVLVVAHGYWLMFPDIHLMKYFLSTKRKKFYSSENIKENPWGIFIQRITNISIG